MKSTVLLKSAFGVRLESCLQCNQLLQQVSDIEMSIISRAGPKRRYLYLATEIANKVESAVLDVILLVSVHHHSVINNPRCPGEPAV